MQARPVGWSRLWAGCWAHCARSLLETMMPSLPCSRPGYPRSVSSPTGHPAANCMKDHEEQQTPIFAAHPNGYCDRVFLMWENILLQVAEEAKDLSLTSDMLLMCRLALIPRDFQWR